MARIGRGPGQRTRRRHSNLSSSDPKEIRREQDELYKIIADLEQEAVDLRALLEAPAAKISREATLTVVTATPTLVEFDTYLFGQEFNVWDTANPTKLVFPTTGRYLLGFDLIWDNIGAVTIHTTGSFQVNGVLAGAGFDIKTVVGATVPQHAYTTLREFNIGDYVELWVTHDVGADHDLLTAQVWHQFLGQAARLTASGPLGEV